MTILENMDTGMAPGWWGLIVPGAVAIIGAIGKCIVDVINAYRSQNHVCPKHCITKKPLPKKSKKVNGKPKG